jgi:ABC-type maltose transport system permease subunit
MKNVKFQAAYKEKASRLELFVRILWIFPSLVVLFVLLFIGAFAGFVQFFHILFLGKRNKFLHKWIWRLVSYQTKYVCYKSMLTDERSPIVPED